MLKTIATAILTFCTAYLFGQQDLPDTLPAPKKDFWHSKTVNISLAPAGFFAASALTWNQRGEVRKFRNRYIPTFRHHYDDYLQYLPAVTVFGLNAAGVKGKHTVKRAFVSYAFSAVIMGSIVNTIKYTAKVERPDGSSNNSFPSGHTANSFMNASFLHKEYGQYRNPLYSVGAYAASTATAIGRQMNNRHWISDVLAGAGIGILSTEVGYLIADQVFKDRGARPILHKDPIPVDGKPSFVEMRIGFAVMTSKDLMKHHSDVYATNGFNLGVEGAWFFHRNIGVGAEFAFTSFPINDNNAGFDDPDIPIISTGHYTQPMGVRYLHAGPFFNYPLPRNWFITGKFLAGTSVGAEGNIMLPLREEFQDIFQAKELPYIRYKPERAFGWSSGLGIMKRIGRNLGLKAYTNYFHSKHDFKFDIIHDVDQNGHVSFSDLATEKISFNHITFGLALTAILW
ncbi:phosphatase PAP2 family protein [Pseudobacter ginsenosidimutans]|uniref:Membrane-associated phospholipid phosphatase n=1 Tax=Pseudobacter ginsenosidimutans TaxID=661488 RepID=A0A4Q7N430_9BACT|nr:phosphatase PAP2 family protein [Pseudobacter ginsenosidimutans]QEC44285.1 phosphatase PAP2 family protein [Pseudobacter ginsenosidimutans]RZS75746.1 membrane-associated phospholipid phosphatase [Pseudobacter ginsenosidimutans]